MQVHIQFKTKKNEMKTGRKTTQFEEGHVDDDDDDDVRRRRMMNPRIPRVLLLKLIMQC